MASRLLLRSRTAATAAVTVAASLSLTPMRRLDAEAPSVEAEILAKPKRRSFYDNETSTPVLSQPANGEPVPKYKPSETITPTDRLANQIRAARVSLHGQAASLEDRFNAFAARAFSLEHSLTSTIASLAPSRQSGEQVMPGAIYVVVSAMGASVVTRNRNILLRATAPVVAGVVAANYLLPVTSRNVGDLIWTYEQKFPALADAHVKTKARVEKFVRTGIAHAGMSKDLLEDKIGEVRESLEGWVSKGN